MMKEDIESIGAVRLRDVDEAQVSIVQVAKALSEANEIFLATGGEDDEMVY